MISQHKENLSHLKHILVDGGYRGSSFEQEVKKILQAHIEVEVAKRNELHKFIILPKRWVVERSFAWLDKCRRLWKNTEKHLNTSLHMVILAFISLILKRL
jgi:transposase